MPILNILNDKDDETTITESRPPCQICQKQFSQYVCPRCNLKYCSLGCYKDLGHADCTESFYRDSVTAEIQSRNDTEQSKQKMLQLLQRFEEENKNSLDGEDEDDEDEDEDKDDLAQRLGDLNIETADAGQLWNKLSSQERDDFEMMLKQLENEDTAWSSLELRPYEPWWEINQSLVQEIGQDNVAQENTSTKSKQSGAPEVPKVPSYSRLIGSDKAPNPAVMWTMLHTGMTYCYLMRHCMGDLNDGNVLDTLDTLEHLSRSVLFSTDPPPFSREMDVVVDLVEQILSLDSRDSKKNKKDPKRRSQLMVLCLSDGLRLLEANHMVRALGGLWQFLKDLSSIKSMDKIQKRRVALAVRKVYFHIAATDYIITRDSQSGRITLLKQALLTAQEKIRSDDRAFEREYSAAIAARQHSTATKQVKIIEL
ncbi:hypothetical protein F4703DRAFT_1193684 [Phycomyces blakesleeanus]|uniref:HIT-type domain-containing protein n=1 Tax=Phycomyces blakesleeanus (strain ATCC 8743b / DSM 1359 / FGSC 10004 / NBRC 33097 / NRRL 1555) TaxID=763407 RepID=A0A167JCI4_PHYB8|nr:hypothetical protein PHYBLDRAFT_153193 [Phycomyces blakesleeanus NRRL 1555(-)]OAD65716.1 hypothetical protein PHYBLDRAFT_153193 [Phycomyces blakesleeanus NRRL 1555(-)]|eukprot:XP_018283756.1 hypothetical protein PHYBLDRAFT_153193 [Phycomyces blakesleeanus NRRL 1555(-)]